MSSIFYKGIQSKKILQGLHRNQPLVEPYLEKTSLAQLPNQPLSNPKHPPFGIASSSKNDIVDSNIS